mgnify:CR=1 FL=1
MTEHDRKRAFCKMPMVVLAEALGITSNQVLMTVQQSYDDMKDGVVELLIEGDGLDEHFRTAGAAIQGVPKFYDDTGKTELWIVPPKLSETSTESE